jgi:hypothetical protein
MENRDVHAAPAKPAKGPVKVKSGDFDPPGAAAPLIDDNPPRTQAQPVSPETTEGPDEPQS